MFTAAWHDAQHSAGILRDAHNDGVMVIAVATDSDILATLAETELFAVAVSSGDGHDIPSVDVDNPEGARLAAGHLLTLRYTRVAHLSGDDNLVSATERREAFSTATSAAGWPVDAAYLLSGSYEAASGYDRACRLLALPTPPTAINVARNGGADVPGQLSMVGFDDIPLLSQVTPGLMTIRQPLTENGATGSRILIALVEDGYVQLESRLFAPELVIRRSTAPPF